MSATAADWQKARQDHKTMLLWNADAHALAYIANQVITDQQAEIERLKGELDGYQGRTVMHCTDAQLDAAALQCLGEPDGTILRATDTGRELVLHDGAWLPR